MSRWLFVLPKAYPGRFDNAIPFLDRPERFEGGVWRRVRSPLDGITPWPSVDVRRCDARLAVRDALARLGIDRLVLSIHQASFPAGPDDLDHGTPHATTATAAIGLATRLGFTGLSLGPAGTTSRGNRRPYDATAMSRNPLHIAPAALTGDEYGATRHRGLLEQAVADHPAGDCVSYPVRVGRNPTPDRDLACGAPKGALW